MIYTKCLTYNEAFLIMQTHKAKIVSWPCRESDKWFLLVVQEEVSQE